jgi:hypothetical protein
MASQKKIKRIDSFQVPDNAPPDSYFIGMVDGKMTKIPNGFIFQQEEPIEITTYMKSVEDE